MAHLLAAITAFFIGLFALYSGALFSASETEGVHAPAPRFPDQPELIDLQDPTERREAINRLVDEFLERFRARAAEAPHPAPHSSPSAEDHEPEDATPGEKCRTEHFTGEGRTSTTVACSSRNLGRHGPDGSSIVISSSKISVSSATSGDEP